MSGGNTRGQSEVIGEILLVGITVVAVSTIGIWAVGYLGYLGGPTERTVISFEETNAGVALVPEHLSENVSVRIEGDEVETIGPEDVGDRVFVPAAPGEVVTVVSADDDREVLTADIIHQGESGDFVAHYTYDSGSGSTIDDGSENGNDGTLSGNPTWGSDENGSYVAFDGTGDYATVSDITVDDVDDVDTLTIGFTFRIDEETGDGNNYLQQLFEHRAPNGDEVFLETTDSDAPFDLNYAVDYPSESSRTSSSPIATTEVHTVVATFDQDAGTYDLYLDGDHVAGGTHSQSIAMGELRLAKDYESDIQYLDGRLYETRIYYTAFDEAEVERLTKRME